MSSTRKNVFCIVVCVIVTLLMIWGVTWYRQQRYFQRGEEYFSRQDYLRALHDYEAAVRFYTPFSKGVATSVARMLWIADYFRDRNMVEESLMAYRAIKTSLYAIRSFYEPFRVVRDEAERNERELIGKDRENAAAVPAEEASRTKSVFQEDAGIITD